VCEERITLHLANTNTTALRSALDGLTRNCIHRTSGANLVLVANHVSKALIVYDPEVYVGSELAASDATVHRFVTVVIVTSFAKLVTEVVGCRILFGELERGGILWNPVQSASLARHRLNHLSDSHTYLKVRDDVAKPVLIEKTYEKGRRAG
jgi:hypothetical protein